MYAPRQRHHARANTQAHNKFLFSLLRLCLFFFSWQTAARHAAEMMQTPLTVAMVGVACILAPILITILAPLILVLTPLLLPVGLGLTFFGLGRAGLIATLGGAAPQQQQIPYRRNNRFSRDWPVEDLSLIHI